MDPQYKQFTYQPFGRLYPVYPNNPNNQPQIWDMLFADPTLLGTPWHAMVPEMVQLQINFLTKEIPLVCCNSSCQGHTQQ